MLRYVVDERYVLRYVVGDRYVYLLARQRIMS